MEKTYEKKDKFWSDKETELEIERNEIINKLDFEKRNGNSRGKERISKLGEEINSNNSFFVRVYPIWFTILFLN